VEIPVWKTYTVDISDAYKCIATIYAFNVREKWLTIVVLPATVFFPRFLLKNAGAQGASIFLNYSTGTNTSVLKPYLA